ncbi:MAG: hypothetical protein ACOWW1_05900 [archaeon]|nr:hypothetical protein [Candidatus Bathyarchaeum sp.]
MIQTKDITTVIMMAVLQLVITVLIVQMGTLITGIVGTNFLFTIFLAIPISFSLLTYEGRRWRLFIQLALFTLLAMPTTLGGAPFDPTPRLSSLTTAFLLDLVANQLYGFFKKNDKLIWWSILSSIIYWIMTPFFKMVVFSIFYAPGMVESFISVVSLLLPVIIAEAMAGAYVGYKIYNRQLKC